MVHVLDEDWWSGALAYGFSVIELKVKSIADILSRGIPDGLIVQA